MNNPLPVNRRLSIDPAGRLLDRGHRVTADTLPECLHPIGSSRAMDGTRVLLWQVSAGPILKQFGDWPDATWEIEGSLCTPADIDAVRRGRGRRC